MTCQQNCFALFFQLQQYGPDISRPLFIQTVKRLIQNQKFRIFHYCLCYPQSLPHTQGIFRHRLFQIRVKPYLLQALPNALSGDFAFQISQNFQILSPRILCQKSGCLNDQTQTFGKIRISSYIFLPHTNAPRCDRQKAADTFHEYSLAGTVISYDPVHLSPLHRHGRLLQNHFLTESLCHPVYHYIIRVLCICHITVLHTMPL